MKKKNKKVKRSIKSNKFKEISRKDWLQNVIKVSQEAISNKSSNDSVDNLFRNQIERLKKELDSL